MYNSGYIVYHNGPRLSDDKSGGYFVSYKSRYEDNYSQIFIQAKVYKSFTSGLKRFYNNNKQFSIEFFPQIEKQVNKQLSRKRKLSIINDIKLDLDLDLDLVDWDKIKIIEKGKIEKIKFNGTSKPTLSSANKEIYLYMKNLHTKYVANNQILKDMNIVGIDDDSFWE